MAKEVRRVAAKALPAIRIGRLDTLPRVRRELVRVYKMARTGEIPASEAGKFAFILMTIGKLIEQGDNEKRLQALELLAKERGA
jgi:hypothetical protein